MVIGASMLKVGDHFGDIDLLHRGLRSCTLQAASQCGLLCIGAEDFHQVLRRTRLEEAVRPPRPARKCQP